MECPECRHLNPENSKFCNECGSKLVTLCPDCGKRNPPRSELCSECGSHFALPHSSAPRDLTFEEKLEKIQRYLPEGLAEKILSQRDKIEGERRQVTIMFCDMKGFTPLAEMLGADETFSLMDQIFEILIRKVNEYQGTVNEIRGDGVLAFFGAPIALEDGPQQAIRSALAIHREMSRFNERIRTDRDIPPVLQRIGINTGPVVLGALGNDLRVQFTAVGDTINMAARMEQLAVPGTTYVTEETFMLTEGFFRFEALGAQKVKGKEKPMNVYRVIAPSTRRTRFDVSAERGLTPFVGRERELQILLDGFERCRGGRGQAVSIISDAGIGKSRLLYEFRKAVSNENITFREGRCLSYSRNVAYHPIVDILRADSNIQENDRDQEIREKVAKSLQLLELDEASTLPFLLELLSVKDPGMDTIPMSPETRKDRTLDALIRIVLRGSELRPIIMAIEDLHWMDRSSEDALKELLKSIPEARVFLIFTYRPDFVHTWGSRSFHSQVTLERLSNQDALAMASHILDTADIDRDLADLILQKTEGIPFFIEEFIKSLKSLGTIEMHGGQYRLSRDRGKLTIPSTIQDVIMARVDILPGGAREVLRTGSVIEREFSHELITRVAGFPEQELLSHLSTLKDSELINERGIYPESTYIFKHALTREVVYDSILTRKRKQLHERIAHTMEEIFKPAISDHYSVVAGHFFAGEKYEKGAEYFRLEAKKYQKAAFFKDAIEHQKMSIKCLERLPQTEENQKKIIDARTTLASYHLTLAHNSEAKDAVEPVLDTALALNYRKGLPGIYTALGLHALWVEEDFESGIPYINEALRISEEIGDFLSLWTGNNQLGVCLSFQCEFEKALSHFERCLELSEMADNPLGIIFTKGLIIHVSYMAGNISHACRVGEEASRFAEGSGDILSKGWVHTYYGCALYYRGTFDAAEQYLLEGLTYSRKTSQSGSEAWGARILGDLYFDRGAYGKAQDYYIKAIQSFERPGIFPSAANALKIYLARARARTRGLHVDLSELIKISKNNKLKYLEGMIARNIGDILLHGDDRHMEDAEKWIRKAVETDGKNGTRWYLATDHALYADWFKKKGNLSGAREQLSRAIKIFRECGAPGWADRAEKERTAL